MTTTDSMTRRFEQAHVDQWRDEGIAIVAGFFTPNEIAAIADDYERLYGPRRPGPECQAKTETEAGVIGQINALQFANMDTLPYDGSPEMNLISLHPALIEFARALLGVDSVHLYQSNSWAKFTGQANYDQPFHCDFLGHTLTAPADDVSLRAVSFVLYFSDVTDAHGALHYVTKPDVAAILGAGALAAPTNAQQGALKARARSAAGPAGTLVAYGIDTFHRGTDMTIEGGHRYTMTAGYKAAGNEMIGFHVWKDGVGGDWSPLFEHGSPKQLACLGIPPPGDSFWTPRTLQLTQARWPGWDMSAYFDAAGS